MTSIAIIPLKNFNRIVYKAIKSPKFALQSFHRRFTSYLTYAFGNGYSAPPETISFFLTYKCNLRCMMCGQWGEQGIYKEYSPMDLRQKISLPSIKRVINEVAKFNPTITLFGGEPMLYDGWLEVLKEVKNKGLRCNIVTNGVLLAQYAEEMVTCGLDEIIFSLDGPQEIHDRIKRVKNTFHKTMEGFDKLKKIKNKYKKNKPFVTINSTINEYNYFCLEELPEIANRVEAYHINIHHLLFLHKKISDHHNEFFKKTFKSSSTDWYGFCAENLPNIDINFLLNQIKKIKRKKKNIGVSFYPNFSDQEIREYYSKWEFESKSYANRCLSPWMVAYIFPDGSVKPYHTMNYVTGNINNNLFLDIWNNRKYRKFRKIVKKIKKFPVCAKGCTELYRY